MATALIYPQLKRRSINVLLLPQLLGKYAPRDRGLFFFARFILSIASGFHCFLNSVGSMI
jgi:hypothetical protein